jgi:hypothetical protein
LPCGGPKPTSRRGMTSAAILRSAFPVPVPVPHAAACAAPDFQDSVTLKPSTGPWLLVAGGALLLPCAVVGAQPLMILFAGALVGLRYGRCAARTWAACCSPARCCWRARRSPCWPRAWWSAVRHVRDGCGLRLPGLVHLAARQRLNKGACRPLQEKAPRPFRPSPPESSDLRLPLRGPVWCTLTCRRRPPPPSPACRSTSNS